MLFFKIAGVVIGSLIILAGLFLRKASAPDPELARLHRADARAEMDEGDRETAERSLRYADEAETGEHLAPAGSVGIVLIVCGVVLAVVSLVWLAI
jgi:hypothetical protein